MTAPNTPIHGRALRFGDHLNADVLHPSSFFSLDDLRVERGFLGAMEPARREALIPGEAIIVVAGCNFGCGSSRETTVRAFQLAGVQAVVAMSFGRIFQRNLLNIGLEAFELAAPLSGEIEDGDALEIDGAHAVLTRLADGARYDLCARDPYLDAVAAAGGLIELLDTLP